MRPVSSGRASEHDRNDDAPHLALVGGSRDEALVSALRLGDVRAFDVLFDAYYAPLCEFAAGYVGSDAVAEECVQDVFLRLWERRATWVVQHTIRQYLYGAVRNQALNLAKHARVTYRWADAAARDPELSMLATASPGADAATVAADFDAALTRAIARFPERRKQVCILRWRHDLTYSEIAGALGLTVKAVEMQLARALKDLRRDLAPYR